MNRPNEVKVATSSRRQFVKQSAAMVAGLSVPHFVPSSALAKPGKPGANDRIHIGVIAAGARSEYLVKNLPPAGQIVAICDCNSAKMDGLLQRSGKPKWKTYRDIRKMIDQHKMDAVIVATIDHARVLASILACQAGLDVYAEKPLTLTIGEGQALVRAVRKYNRILQVGTRQRSMEPNHWAVEKIRDGAIGKVKTVLARQYKSPFFYKNLPRENIPAGLA
jgi:predicted dehydrogenase